jgi:signal transduction histidine kinase
MEVGQSLRTVLETTHQAVNSWLKEHQSAALVWANTAEVRQATKELLITPRIHQALVAAPAQTRLHSWLRPINIGKGYRGYFVIGPDRVNLASSRDQNIGVKSLLSKQAEFFKKTLSGKTAVSLPVKSEVPLSDKEGIMREGMPTMFVGAPVNNEFGKVIAVFAFRIDPSEDFTTILQQGRIGFSGETYAFDNRGRLISESRFDDQLRRIGLLDPDQRAILNIELRDPGVNLLTPERSTVDRSRQPLTHMAVKAVAGKSGMNLDGYRDYRGVSVVGAWLWDPALGFGITTEIDSSDAYNRLRSTRYVILALTGMSIFLLFGLTMVYIANRKHILDGEQRLVERTTEAERRAEELEQFAYVTSHDLKEPLRGIRILASWLQEDLQGELNVQTREQLDLLGDRVKRMQALIEGLFEYCQVGRKKGCKKIIDTKAMLAEILDSLSPMSGFVIDVAPDMPVLYTDSSELRQVFANLISNAIKHHGGKQGSVSVNVRDIGKYYEFSVTDDGPGIAPQYHKKIFMMFQTLAVKDHGRDTGIGLALVKKIVEERGGSITLESREGEGAKFKFAWPKACPECDLQTDSI